MPFIQQVKNLIIHRLNGRGHEQAPRPNQGLHVRCIFQKMLDLNRRIVGNIGKLSMELLDQGKRVSRAIEEILHRHPQVQHVAVVGVPHEFFGEDIVAAIVVSEQTPGNSVDLAKELQDICRSRLSEVEVPSRIEFLKELPLSSTGKVQKAELRRYLANGT